MSRAFLQSSIGVEARTCSRVGQQWDPIKPSFDPIHKGSKSTTIICA